MKPLWSEKMELSEHLNHLWTQQYKQAMREAETLIKQLQARR